MDGKYQRLLHPTLKFFEWSVRTVHFGKSPRNNIWEWWRAGFIPASEYGRYQYNIQWSEDLKQNDFILWWKPWVGLEFRQYSSQRSSQWFYWPSKSTSKNTEIVINKRLPTWSAWIFHFNHKSFFSYIMSKSDEQEQYFIHDHSKISNYLLKLWLRKNLSAQNINSSNFRDGSKLIANQSLCRP